MSLLTRLGITVPDLGETSVREATRIAALRGSYVYTLKDLHGLREEIGSLKERLAFAESKIPGLTLDLKQAEAGLASALASVEKLKKAPPSGRRDARLQEYLGFQSKDGRIEQTGIIERCEDTVRELKRRLTGQLKIHESYKKLIAEWPHYEDLKRLEAEEML